MYISKNSPTWGIFSVVCFDYIARLRSTLSDTIFVHGTTNELGSMVVSCAVTRVPITALSPMLVFSRTAFGDMTAFSPIIVPLVSVAPTQMVHARMIESDIVASWSIVVLP